MTRDSLRRARAFRSMLLIPLGLTLACGGGGQAAGPGAAGAPGGGRGPAMAVPVEILTLAEKPIEQTGEFVGTVKSLRSTTIQPQAEGYLTRMLVKSGDAVKAGTPLFEIDATTQQAAVASLESERAAAEAAATFARQQAERAKRLLGVGAMSQQEYEWALSQQQAAEAQLKAIQERIRQQRAELAYYRVVAPTAGVVGDIAVRLGDRVTRSTQLTMVEDNSSLEVYVQVPAQDGPRLKLGLPMHLLDETGKTLATQRITYISRSVDEATQTVLVKTQLEGRGSLFRTDQFVRARIVFANTPGITVPVVSLNRINGQYFAFVAEPGEGGALIARQRAVTVGPVVGNDYIVRAGLKAGDRLITSGIQKIGDGVPVMAAPPGTPSAEGTPSGKGR